MTKAFAAGKKAFGFCDRCGFRAPLGRMRGEFVRGKPKNNLVCSSCWDGDHPQNWQGAQDMSDPQALRNPRPDLSLQASRNIPNKPSSTIVTESQVPLATEDGSALTTEE